MTTTTEIERFRQDHATPEAAAAFFSGLPQSPRMDDIVAALQAGGYDITDADLQDAAGPASGHALSDKDLDAVNGGITLFERVIIGIGSLGISEAVWYAGWKKHGIDVRNGRNGRDH